MGDALAAMTPDTDLQPVIRRNTVILAGCLALSWSVVQLLSTVGAPVLAELTGRTSLAGFAPGIYLSSWAVATLGTGRYMDARGRAAGIRLGFLVGAAGCALAFVAVRERSLVPYL